MYSNQALALSDMDATYLELEQAALEQSMESYSKNEHGKKKRASTGRSRSDGRSSPESDSPSTSEKEGPKGSTSFASRSSNNVASLPSSAAGNNQTTETSIPPAAAASVASAPSEITSHTAAAQPRSIGTVDEYPQIVQELVMNGFPLAKVVHAYELIGENFDDLVAFLMSSVSS
jgi:hypothetical protein